MNRALASRPIVPEDLRRNRPADFLARAVLASAKSVYRGGAAEKVAREDWPDDRSTLSLLTRAATAPADTSTSGWASQLAQTTVSDVITTPGPANAGAELLLKATVLTLDRGNRIAVPAIVSAATDVPFVAEGAPIPVRQLTVGGPTLELRKFATAFVLTRELVEHSGARCRNARARCHDREC